MPFSPLRKKLTSEGTLVVTVNNKPFALMISVDEENVHDILLMLSRIRTQMAACAIRSQAPRDGVNNMTLKEINALIKKTRKERNEVRSYANTSRHLS